MQGAIEDFAQELALIIRRYLKLKAWRDTERIVVGGGFRGSRVGELAIGRTSVILKADKVAIDLVPIRHEPDEAGLIGAVHLAPKWMFEAHDAILAVDIGGTNIRAGVVELNLKKASDLSKAAVWKFELWRHGDEKKLTREDAVDELVGMLKGLITRAGKEGLRARAVHRHRLPRHHRIGRHHRPRRAEPAGQLGEQPLQFAAQPAQGHSQDRRPRDRRPVAQ